MPFTGSDICKVCIYFRVLCFHSGFFRAYTVCCLDPVRRVVPLSPPFIVRTQFVFTRLIDLPSLSHPWESSWSVAVMQTLYVHLFICNAIVSKIHSHCRA